MVLKSVFVSAVILCSVSLANAGAASPGSSGNSGAVHIDNTIVSNDADLLAAFAAPSPAFGFGMGQAEEPWPVCTKSKDGLTITVIRAGAHPNRQVREIGQLAEIDKHIHIAPENQKSKQRWREVSLGQSNSTNSAMVFDGPH
jgi:hypothetical protein